MNCVIDYITLDSLYNNVHIIYYAVGLYNSTKGLVINYEPRVKFEMLAWVELV